MTPMEIALLVIGVIIFVISFLVPDRAVAKSRKEKEKEKEEIRRMMEKELDGMKLRVNEATDETVEYAMDKAERALEKISNEKIMAVNEYSETIMEEINRSHKEVLFLYDMLSDKQVDLKNTVRKAEATAKEVEKTLSVISVSRSNRDIQEEKPVEVRGSGVSVAPVIYDIKKAQTAAPSMEKPVEPISKETFLKPAEPEVKNNNSTKNQNQQILELYELGKSNVEIAKDLGLGVGEVKLVIDLFKG